MDKIKLLLEKTDQLNIQKPEHFPYSILPSLYNRINTKELLHSEIIASFLNPKSEHNCDTFFLFTFFDMINLDKREYENETQFNIYTEYSITDMRRIDILITWKNNAVIIENKLNDAIDQRNQLKDYYTSISEKFKVVKIVYIPRDNKKQAPYKNLDNDLIKLIHNVYPNDLIEWINKFPQKEDIKETCISYSNLLKYMNLKNQNIMKANMLLKELNNEEIKSLVTLYNIVKTTEWNLAVLSQVTQKLNIFDPQIKCEVKENRYIEIYYDNYKFWIELYFYFESSIFELWVANKNVESLEDLESIEFKHYSIDSKKGYHYFENKNKHSYLFPTEDNYEKLIADILSLLKVSK